MNQISTQSSLEVTASISLTGHLVPEHGHQWVDVTILIVMFLSSSMKEKKKPRKKGEKLGRLSIKGEKERGSHYLLGRVGMPHHLS